MQSREELLATLRRLEKNPATAHLMVRATKGRKVAPQERLLKRVLRGADVATQVAEDEFHGPEGSTTPPSPTADCPTKDKDFREKVTRACEHEAAIGAGRATPMAARRWMGTKEVLSYVGISSATLYRLVNEQGFPRPRKLGQLSRWLRDEIDAYMMTLPVMVIPKIDWVDGKKPKKK